MTHGRRRPSALFVAAATTIALFVSVPPAHAAGQPPSLRLIAASAKTTVTRYSPGRFPLDLGVWVASVGGAFQLNVSRPDYDTPIGVTQVDAQTGAALRTLPPDVLDGWYGLKDFLYVTLLDGEGNQVFRGSFTFCPNNYDPDRVDDQGPELSRYPPMCSANPFTLGMVWGIDDHWAVNPGLAYAGITVDVPDGEYTAIEQIGAPYVDMLGIASQDASATVDVTVVSTGPYPYGLAQRGDQLGRASSVPTVTDPAPDTVPDLGALPAWSISVSKRHKHHEDLNFAATAWNAGPQPMVVEGFRQPGADTMDAFQYFYRDGQPIGRAPVGTFEYDSRPSHQHWHFQQFATYSLLDANLNEVVPSTKEGFCLAPTDAIDLTRPGANWLPYTIGLSTACGGPDAIWIREELDAGWGDTYFQSLPGQSFDITDLPNGKYFIQVVVNPTGSLFEASTSNDVSLRRVILRGRPGERRVVVPPYHGIDSESSCPYCYRAG